MNPNDIIIISWYHIISSYNIIHHLPSGKLTVCDIEHGPVEIVGFPIIARVIFHGFWNVYQRLNPDFPYLPEVKSICSTKNGDFPYVVIPIIPLFNPKTRSPQAAPQGARNGQDLVQFAVHLRRTSIVFGGFEHKKKRFPIDIYIYTVFNTAYI